MAKVKLGDNVTIQGTASAVFESCERTFAKLQRTLKAFQEHSDTESLPIGGAEWDTLWDCVVPETKKLPALHEEYERAKCEFEQQTASCETKLEEIRDVLIVVSTTLETSD